MQYKEFIVDLDKLSEMTVEKVAIKLEGYEDIDLDRYAIVGVGRDQEPKILSMNVSDKYDKKSPVVYISNFTNTNKGKLHYVGVEDTPYLEYVPITCGKVVLEGGEYTRVINRVKIDPHYIIKGPIDILVYKLVLVRYDKEKNDNYWEFVIQNDELDTFYLSDKVNIDKVVQDIEMSFSDPNYREIRKSLYRFITANKANNYKGFEKISEIPYSSRYAKANLAELLKVLNECGDKVCGYSVGSTLVGWVHYCNSVRFSGDIIKELMFQDRDYFIKSLKKFQPVLDLLDK